jgi:hypothetical protein
VAITTAKRLGSRPGAVPAPGMPQLAWLMGTASLTGRGWPVRRGGGHIPGRARATSPAAPGGKDLGHGSRGAAFTRRTKRLRHVPERANVA